MTLRTPSGLAVDVNLAKLTSLAVIGRSRAGARPLGDRYLSATGASALLGRLARDGIAGGSVYDALVRAAADEHGLQFVTRDRRAVDTYRALGVHAEIELIPNG